jgi:hypothetical protein
MKKLAVFYFLFAAGIIFSLYAAISSVEVIVNKVSAYESEKNTKGKPVFTANNGDQLKVIELKKDMVKVQNGDGAEGWVKKAQVKPISTGNSQVKDDNKPKGSSKSKFVMDEAKVQGYLDNPQAVYILDMSDPSFKPIKLERSLKDNLGGNIDKETNQRINDPSLKPEQ